MKEFREKRRTIVHVIARSDAWYLKWWLHSKEDLENLSFLPLNSVVQQRATRQQFPEGTQLRQNISSCRDWSTQTRRMLADYLWGTLGEWVTRYLRSYGFLDILHEATAITTSQQEFVWLVVWWIPHICVLGMAVRLLKNFRVMDFDFTAYTEFEVNS